MGFGLPDHFRPDEEFLVPVAIDLEKDWNPHWSICPPAQTYLVHAALRVYARMTGAGENLHDVYAPNNEAQAYSIARRITAAMGTATVPIIYLAAAPVFGQVGALAASAIVAVSYIHVRDSKFAKDEVPAGFWLALSIMMMLRIASRGHLGDYVIAGLFCGLAAATHYPAGAISIGILVAHLEARRGEGRSLTRALADSRIYFAGCASIVAFLAADPYFLLDWSQTVASYKYIRNDYVVWSASNTPAGSGWRWLLFWAMPAGFGVELEIFLLAALGWAIFHPRSGTFALLAFIAACFLSLTNGHPQVEFRYLINPLLAMALLGGLFFADLLTLTSAWIGTEAACLMAVPVGLLLLLPSSMRDIELDTLLHQPDTRTIAREWIRAHVSRASIVLILGDNSSGKPQRIDDYLTFPLDSLSNMPVAPAYVSKWLVTDSLPPLSYWSKGVSAEDLAELNSKATLELDLNPIIDGAAPVFDPNDAFYAPFNNITSMSRPGPRIRIWKLSEPSPPKSQSNKKPEEG